MRIAFVCDFEEKLGVEYISAILKQNGFETKAFVDPQLFDDHYMNNRFLAKIFDHSQQVIDQVIDYDPQIVCFSVLTDFYQWACKIAKCLKEKKQEVVTVMGNIHATLVPEVVLENSYMDVACVGEGEYAMLELARSVESGNIDYSIKNLWFRRNGNIIKNPPRNLIEDLDSVPFPDKEIFYKATNHLRPTYYIIASRGCPYKCSYCLHSYLKDLYAEKGKYVRFRSVENVMDELLRAKERYNIKIVRFHDEILYNNKDWFRRFCQEYSKEIGLPFSCEVHARMINDETASLLKMANCSLVGMGIQIYPDPKEGNDFLNRYISKEVLTNAIGILNKHKILISADNIYGLPGQGEKEMIQLAEFYIENKVAAHNLYGIRYFPKYALTKNAKQLGVAINEEDIYRMERAIDSSGFLMGGDVVNNDMYWSHFLFGIVINYFPRSVVRFIIKKRVYRYFPGMPYWLYALVDDWLKIPMRYQWSIKRNLIRYSKFVVKKILRIK